MIEEIGEQHDRVRGKSPQSLFEFGEREVGQECDVDPALERAEGFACRGRPGPFDRGRPGRNDHIHGVRVQFQRDLDRRRGVVRHANPSEVRLVRRLLGSSLVDRRKHDRHVRQQPIAIGEDEVERERSHRNEETNVQVGVLVVKVGNGPLLLGGRIEFEGIEILDVRVHSRGVGLKHLQQTLVEGVVEGGVLLIRKDHEHVGRRRTISEDAAGSKQQDGEEPNRASQTTGSGR